MQRNNRIALWNARWALVLLPALFVMMLGSNGCSRSPDTPPAQKAAAPQPVAQQPAPAPAAPVKTDAGAAKLPNEQTAQKATQAPASGPAINVRPQEPTAKAGPDTKPARPEPVKNPTQPGKTPILDGESLELTPPAADQPQPKAVFDQEVFMADPIWRGQTAKFVFHVRNEGEGVLNGKMKACCGLKINGVGTGWPGWSLKPGQDEVFEMTLAPTAPGEFTRFSPLHTNDPNNPKINFTCKGRVLVAFNLEPRVINLGKPAPDSGPITKSVTITRGDGGPLQPKLLPIKDTRITAQLREVEAGQRYTLDVTVTPPLPIEYRSSIVIETGIEQLPRETVHVMTQVDKE